ncbi:MAG: DUF928 domain-containing protein [Phormidesmis sp.]
MKRTGSIKLFPAIAFGLTATLGGLCLPSYADNINTDNVRQGLPGRRISGGVRMEPPADSCFSDFNQSLVSIMPRSNLGTTLASHPTFWFSVPETVGDKAVEFQLLNEADDLLYSTQVNVGDESGLREFQLPASAPALAIDENYKWIFSFACNNGSRSPVLGLQGWVRRVEASAAVNDELMLATPEERVVLYSSAGIWQEQVSALLNLRRQGLADADLQLAWTDLLASTGLTSEISDNVLGQMSPVTPTVDATALSTRSDF